MRASAVVNRQSTRGATVLRARYHAVGEQVQRPALAARGRRAAGQRNQMRLAPAVQRACLRGAYVRVVGVGTSARLDHRDLPAHSQETTHSTRDGSLALTRRYGHPDRCEVGKPLPAGDRP